MLRTVAAHIKSVSSRLSKTSKPAQSGLLKNQDILPLPVILNSNEDSVDKRLVDLLLQTIFGKDCSHIPKITSLLNHNSVVSSVSNAEDRIEKILHDLLSNQEPDAYSMLSMFYAHKARSKANSLAYSTEDKPIPNAVFWPNPMNPEHPRNLRTELPFVRKVPLIKKCTPIASAGSCFAVEIAYALQRDGFNYLVKEPNAAADGSYKFKDHQLCPYPTSSAAWGIHFNTPSFLQLVEKAFGLRRPAKLLWTNRTTDGSLVQCDPFREEIEFPTLEAFESNYEKHLNSVRSVFLEAEVFIITLGLNEVWYFIPDGSAFSRSPWRTAPSLVEHKVLTVEENVTMLQKMLEILRTHNPSIKLIVTLSPVPLHATFLAQDKHVVEANTHSKAVLRVAAEEFVSRNENVFYFPSFELITTCLENPWDSDQRHVSSSAVERVMTMFNQMYVYEA